MMRRWAAAAAAAVPACLLAAFGLVSLVLAAFGRYPMWPHEPVNLAEAAGARDEAEVVRLVEAGQDPAARYPLRRGFVFDVPTSLTPLEAAIGADDPQITAWLLAREAPVAPSRWTYLHCITGGDEVPEVLERFRPQNAVPDCDGVRMPWPQDE
jgi:hypothetical protein